MTAQPNIRRTAKITAATPKPVKETRDVTVLKRAEVTKANAAYVVNPGDVICLVKNGGGRVYTTILRRSKQHTCTCEGNAKWRRKCYHIDHCVAQENARWEAAQLRAARKAAAEAEMAEITRIAEEARVYGERHAAIKAAEMAEALAEQAKEAVEAELAAAFVAKMAEAKEALQSIEPAKALPRRAYVTNIEAARAHKAAVRAEMAEAKQRAESSQDAEKRRENANLGGTRAFSILR